MEAAAVGVGRLTRLRMQHLSVNPEDAQIAWKSVMLVGVGEAGSRTISFLLCFWIGG